MKVSFDCGRGRGPPYSALFFCRRFPLESQKKCSKKKKNNNVELGVGEGFHFPVFEEAEVLFITKKFTPDDLIWTETLAEGATREEKIKPF